MATTTTLTPGAEKLKAFYLAQWPAAEAENASPPRLAQYQEEAVQLLNEYQSIKDPGRRYRIASRLREIGIEPKDYA